MACYEWTRRVSHAAYGIMLQQKDCRLPKCNMP